jgi:LacI family transcriptional regulator
MALSGDARISALTSQRVKQVAQRLGYRPNRGARGLVMNKSFLLALIAPQSQFRVMEVLAGAQAEATRHRYSVLTFVHDDTLAEERRHLQLAMDCKVDGIMVMPTFSPEGDCNGKALKEISTGGCRVIQLNHHIVDSIYAVRTDYHTSGRKLTERLVALGHRHIVHVTHADFGRPQPHSFAPSRAVEEGYRQAMSHVGIKPLVITEPLEELGVEDRVRCARAMDRIIDRAWEQNPRPTAAVSRFATDAVTLTMALRERGLKVPDDLSIVAASDGNGAAMAWPGITVCREPYEKIGMAAVELLLNPTSKNAGDVDLLIQPDLVIRQSDSILKGDAA